MSQISTEAMLEKIIRARVKLERAKRGHNDRCPVETDPEGYTPCNCGASNTNLAIEEALRELSFKD